MKLQILPLLAGAAFALAAVTSASAGTLDTIKSKGYLQCGVNPSLPGFGRSQAGSG